MQGDQISDAKEVWFKSTKKIKTGHGFVVQPAGSYCFPGKEMAHSIKISLMTLVLSEQKEQKEEGKKIFL